MKCCPKIIFNFGMSLREPISAGHRLTLTVSSRALVARSINQAERTDGLGPKWPCSLLACGATLRSCSGGHHTCRQKHDCLQAVVPLASAQAKGHFIWSLDLSQAFDRLRPGVALRSLKQFGFPPHLANAFQRIWSSQRRVLQWQGESLPTSCLVASSVPQGDPLSSWAVNVVLRTPQRSSAVCILLVYPQSSWIIEPFLLSPWTSVRAFEKFRRITLHALVSKKIWPRLRFSHAHKTASFRSTVTLRRLRGRKTPWWR